MFMKGKETLNSLKILQKHWKALCLCLSLFQTNRCPSSFLLLQWSKGKTEPYNRGEWLITALIRLRYLVVNTKWQLWDMCTNGQFSFGTQRWASLQSFGPNGPLVTVILLLCLSKCPFSGSSTKSMSEFTKNGLQPLMAPRLKVLFIKDISQVIFQRKHGHKVLLFCLNFQLTDFQSVGKLRKVSKFL